MVVAMSAYSLSGKCWYDRLWIPLRIGRRPRYPSNPVGTRFDSLVHRSLLSQHDQREAAATLPSLDGFTLPRRLLTWTPLASQRRDIRYRFLTGHASFPPQQLAIKAHCLSID
jgi:hypothetical protein